MQRVSSWWRSSARAPYARIWIPQPRSLPRSAVFPFARSVKARATSRPMASAGPAPLPWQALTALRPPPGACATSTSPDGASVVTHALDSASPKKGTVGISNRSTRSRDAAEAASPSLSSHVSTASRDSSSSSRTRRRTSSAKRARTSKNRELWRVAIFLLPPSLSACSFDHGSLSSRSLCSITDFVV